MSNIMVIAEQYDGKIASVSLELLGIAQELKGAGRVSAVLTGDGIEGQADTLAGHGADVVYVAAGEVFRHYTTEAYAKAAHRAIGQENPDIVLFGATSTGRDLAPRLSARLNTGLTADESVKLMNALTDAYQESFRERWNTMSFSLHFTLSSSIGIATHVSYLKLYFSQS